MAAFSTLSEYRFTDWLEVFGFSLDDVSRFQAFFPAIRTVELDARVYHTRGSIPWFEDLKRPVLPGPLVPLSQWLAPATPRRFEALSRHTTKAFRYVKIGSQDAFAFPDLLPGSIVRVNPRSDRQISKPPGNNLFLVEHSRGLACCRLCQSEPNKVILCSRQLPYAFVELERGTQAIVLGVADLEIRPVVKVEKPVVPAHLGPHWTPNHLAIDLPPNNVGELIRRARRRSGLSFREASKRTRLIAQTQRDSRYFCSPGSLSDYEATKLPPRHIHKVISICAVYFISAASILEASGVRLDGPGALPMPAEFLDSPLKDRVEPSALVSSYFLDEIERRFEQLPLFLHKTAPSLFGMPDLSVRDVFWAGGIQDFVHPYLAGAAFLVVNRKKKTPRCSLTAPVWAQPVHVLQRRDAGYMCGSCILQNGMLIVRPCAAGEPKLLRLRNRIDADVVGQVVGIIRRLV